MKIVHYIQQGFRLEYAGVVRAVLDLCAALAGRGHDVTLVTVAIRRYQLSAHFGDTANS